MVSELADLETAITGLISGIMDGGSPVFRFVAGFSDADRRAGVAHIRRQVAPAALLVYAGRLRADAADSVVGLPKVSVLISAQNLRGGDDPRAGDGSAYGGFELLGWVMAALDGAVVQTDRRLAALDEQVVAANETHVVYEQRYVIDRVTELTAPTFNGSAVAGASSLVNVLVGEASSESAAFAFAGIDGEFRHHLGMRGREIVWRGQLRAASDAALNTIETNIEAALAESGAHDMVDSWSRTFVDCVAERFVRKGARRRHPVDGQALQGFELRFRQLNV